MFRFPIGFIGGVLLGATIAAAQEVPEPVLPGVAPVQDPATSPSALDEIELPPPEMIRDQPRTSTQSPLLDEPFRRGGTAPRRPDSIAEQIRFRKVKTRALRDPAVAAAWVEIDLAKTDPVKLAARYRFYKLLFARMRRLDKSLAMLPTFEAETYKRLNQSIIPAENSAIIRQREE